MVTELQQSIYDGKSSVTELLRKAYILARKLKIHEFEIWINNELKGYSDASAIPEYRKISGEVRAWNPYHGWQHVFIEDPEIMAIIQSQRTAQSLPEIETLLERSSKNIHISLPDSFSNMLSIHAKCIIQVSPNLLTRITEQVKNIILDWALKLEEDGILGEGMSFTKDEIGTANEQSYSVQNFYGDINDSQIQGNSKSSPQSQSRSTVDKDAIKDIIKSIEENKAQIPMSSKNQDILSDSIRVLQEEIEKPDPKKNTISEKIKTIRNIMEGAAGSIIASGILYKLNLFQ